MPGAAQVLLETNTAGNLQLVVQVAKEYTEQLGAGKIMELLESHKSYHGLYYYLGGHIAFSEDPEVHYKYIEAAAKTGQLKEVERVTRESAHYPPKRVKQFLMEAKLPDARCALNHSIATVQMGMGCKCVLQVEPAALELFCMHQQRQNYEYCLGVSEQGTLKRCLDALHLSGSVKHDGMSHTGLMGSEYRPVVFLQALRRKAVARRPLINVCDRFDMVTDLTHYLYSNNMLRYIEGYVQKVNPAKAPQVVGGLLDAEAPDEFVNNLILSVRSLIPVEQLCAEVPPPHHSVSPANPHACKIFSHHICICSEEMRLFGHSKSGIQEAQQCVQNALRMGKVAWQLIKISQSFRN